MDFTRKRAWKKEVLFHGENTNIFTAGAKNVFV
jgi:hypothetical protein